MESFFEEPAKSLSNNEKFERANPNVSFGGTFILENRHFNKQYASIYFSRLLILRPVILKNIEDKWLKEKEKTPFLCKRISEIPSDDKVVAIVGTVYKDMKLKPTILDEYESAEKKQEKPLENFCSETDFIVLEDESGRVKLNLENIKSPTVGSLVSGIVVGVKGKDGQGGEFVVEDIIFPGFTKQPALPIREDDKFVGFVSGLEVGNEKSSPFLLEMLIDFLSGMSGNSNDARLSSNIIDLFICGNSIVEIEVNTRENVSLKKAIRDHKMKQPLESLDMFLTQLLPTSNVMILPGETDPSNYLLPQQPFHYSLFPCASTYSTFKRLSNPVEVVMDGIKFLGTSGQNLNDLRKYSTSLSNSELLKKMLEWRNIAPTAPDTLDEDPFAIRETPHVFFVGNQNKFETDLIEDENGAKVRLLSIPKFTEDPRLVLINMRDLSCSSISFKLPN